MSITSTGGHSTIQSTKRYQHPIMQKTIADMAKLEEMFEKTEIVS